jgi:hypothetical protein
MASTPVVPDRRAPFDCSHRRTHSSLDAQQRKAVSARLLPRPSACRRRLHCGSDARACRSV